MWLGLPASVIAAYLGAKGEGSRLWTALSVVCWTLVALVILAALSLPMAFLIAAARIALAP